MLFAALSLELRAGRAALVSGPNGAGKTSLLRLVAGLLPLHAGSVEREGRLAFAGEQAALDRDLPLARALRHWARLDGGGRGEVAYALEAMALAPLADVPVRMLSTGQRKRAVLARAIASRAEIWLLDEPANGLDRDSLLRLETALAAHRAAGGIAVVASHQPLALPDATAVTLGEAA